MRTTVSRLCSESGETMVETLCAMLVIVLSMMFLAQAVMSAARANAALEAQDVSFVQGEGTKVGSATLEVSELGGAGDSVTAEVDVFETEGGYLYYDEAGE